MAEPSHSMSPSAPLKGVKIYIIHVKDKLDDGERAEETILRQIRKYEEEEGLGCEFFVVESGMAIFI
jgi:cAMP phosphodiesterase